MSLIKEFKEFVGSGNAIDLAVGVVIGSAMTTIIKSFVDELIVPLPGLLGKSDFSNLYLVIKGEDLGTLAKTREAGAVALGYGSFLTVLVNTLILAFAVFMVVRAINSMKRKSAQEPPAEPPAPPAQEVLLTEIRDLLKAKG
jgi:large conductance mechanosensitive channel